MKRTILCQKIVEAANNFDSQGDHEAVDNLTKLANKLAAKEMKVVEAFNLFRPFQNMLQSPVQMLTGANKSGPGSLEMMLKFVQKRNPQAYPALAQKVQAYRQQGQTLLQELKTSVQAQPQRPAVTVAQDQPATQPAINPTTLV